MNETNRGTVQVIFLGPDGDVIEPVTDRGPEDDVPDDEEWTKFLYWAAGVSPTGQPLLTVGAEFHEHRDLSQVVDGYFQKRLPQPTAAGDLNRTEQAVYVTGWYSDGLNIGTPEGLKPVILETLDARDITTRRKG